MPDPTYDPEKIANNKVWRVAFLMSEFRNDSAPIGWSKYIPDATAVVASLESYVEVES
jgi:hypothetical protein